MALASVFYLYLIHYLFVLPELCHDGFAGDYRSSGKEKVGGGHGPRRVQPGQERQVGGGRLHSAAAGGGGAGGYLEGAHALLGRDAPYRRRVRR